MIFLKRLLSVSLLPLVVGCESEFDKCFDESYEAAESGATPAGSLDYDAADYAYNACEYLQ